MSFLSQDLNQIDNIPEHLITKTKLLEDIAYLSSCFLRSLNDKNFKDADEWKFKLSNTIESYENIAFMDNTCNNTISNICPICNTQTNNNDQLIEIDNHLYHWHCTP